MKPAEGQEGLGRLRVKPGILSPAPCRAAIINYTLNYSRAIKKKLTYLLRCCSEHFE